MRIGFDAKRYFNNQTGLGNYSRNLVHSLASEFVNDEFLLFNKQYAQPLINLPNLKTISPKSPGKFWRTLGLAADAKKEGVQVFHGLSNEIPFGLSKKQIASVVTIHDAIFMRYPEYYPLLDRNIYRRKTAHALKNADKIIATSMATANDLREFFTFDTNKIEVVYQTVNPLFYSFDKKENAQSKPYFIYVSSFGQRKNHGTLIQAFSRIQKMTDWNLMLVGSNGPTLDECKRFIKHENLENRIFIYENLGENELISLMKNASGFVYPSFFEGFGIPLAEAAVCGLPIAASNIAVFKELAEDAAVYFHPNKYEEMADAMLSLTSFESSRNLKNNLPIILNKIDSISIAKQMMDIYQGLI